MHDWGAGDLDVFLVCYLTYHYKMKQVYGEAHTKFVDPAWFRPIYLVILFTHLIGAFAIVPLGLDHHHAGLQGTV
jgi:uncharacterized membrane protein YozB (DUF420 family)